MGDNQGGQGAGGSQALAGRWCFQIRLGSEPRPSLSGAPAGGDHGGALRRPLPSAASPTPRSAGARRPSPSLRGTLLVRRGGAPPEVVDSPRRPPPPPPG